MGSKPKKRDYQASPTENVQASVAAADQRYFRQTYDPLLVEMRDKAAREDIASTLRGRAGADTMQALSPGGGAQGYGMASDIEAAANLAIGATGQMLLANTAAKDSKVTQQMGVLSAARGQAADAGDALAGASRLARSEGLARAAGKQQVRLAKRKAAFDIGMAFADRGIKNKLETGKFSTTRSQNVSVNPNNPNEYGYRQTGPLGSSRDFSVLGTYTAKPTNTGGY